MSSLFSKPDNSAAEKRIADQDAAIKKKEASQAKELQARRKASQGGATSKTLFSQVLGIDEAKKDTLG